MSRLSVVALAVLAVTAACTDGGDVPPRTTPTSAPTPPAEATATTAPLPGMLVYLRDGDLWIAPLDGSADPRSITSGAIVAGFAGAVDGKIYYVEQTTEGEVVENRSEAELALYRADLVDGEPEELLRYRGRPLEPWLGANAAVSSDGAYVLYAEAGGMSLLNVADRSSRRLLTNSPPCEGPAGCFAYHRPRWSPSGDAALITKTFWEGGADIIIDPFADAIDEIRTPGGAAFDARWSPNGERICVSEFTYSVAGAALVYDIATGGATDSTLELPLPTPPEEGRLRINTLGCAWAGDGTLAIAYHAPTDYSESTIAIISATFEVIQESAPISVPVDIVAWLPDGSGVLFNRRQVQEGLQPGIFHLGRGVLGLPVEADAVVAVLP